MAKLNVMHSLMLSVWEGLSNHKPQASSYIKHMPSSVFFCSITFASLTVSKPLHGPKQKGWGKRRGSRVHVETENRGMNLSLSLSRSHSLSLTWFLILRWIWRKAKWESEKGRALTQWTRKAEGGREGGSEKEGIPAGMKSKAERLS